MQSFGLIIFTIITLASVPSGLGRKFQWEDDDTIITEATREEDTHNVIFERQDIPVSQNIPVRIIGPGGGIRGRAEKRTCYSSLGDQGMCSTFKECFPMLYYTDSEHMGEVKHPVLAELLMSTSGPCDPLPFSFRDDFPGAYAPVVEEDVSDLICCPNMKLPEPIPTKKTIAKKATTTTQRTTTTGKWGYVPDMMVGQMMTMEVVPVRKNPVHLDAMRPMGNAFGENRTSTAAPALEVETTTFSPNQGDSGEGGTTILPPVVVDEIIEAAGTIGPVVAENTEFPESQPSVEIVTETPPVEVLNAPCGYLNTSRDPSQPWVAAIKLDKNYICTGSVIDSYHVLTAAHCIAHLSSLDVGRLRVYLGEKILNSNIDGPMVIRKVYRAMHHRGYSLESLQDDIGLLKLNLPIPIKTNRVKPVCLPTQDENLVGGEATIGGWGPRWNSDPHDHILENRFQIWSNTGCSNAYKHLSPGINITESMICAQYYHVKPKEMSSYYDVNSGGSPVIVKNKDGTNVQVGIYSWRLRTSSAYPYVLTRVSQFPRWIQKNRLRK